MNSQIDQPPDDFIAHAIYCLSTAPVSQRSWFPSPFKPEIFSGFLFAIT